MIIFSRGVLWLITLLKFYLTPYLSWYWFIYAWLGWVIMHDWCFRVVKDEWLCMIDVFVLWRMSDYAPRVFSYCEDEIYCTRGIFVLWGWEILHDEYFCAVRMSDCAWRMFPCYLIWYLLLIPFIMRIFGLSYCYFVVTVSFYWIWVVGKG